MKSTTRITTIDQVIEALDQIIADTQQKEDPLGYFAALYRNVTISVKKGIEYGVFEDNDRMEQLDVIFATRYLDAYYAYKSRQETTRSWKKAFNLSTHYWPIVLQHLLIGMNAHINLDLGIASAQVMQGKNINDLKTDFDHINTVLASLVANVENDLGMIYPAFKWILKVTRGFDTLLTNFSMKEARNGAWKFAVRLSETSSENLEKTIGKRDKKVAAVGTLITSPGLIVSWIFKLIRIGERGSVAEKIRDMTN